MREFLYLQLNAATPRAYLDVQPPSTGSVTPVT
jgi:hypothetical protein